MLLCGFCYQAARVLTEDIRCTACGAPAGNPDADAIVVLKVAEWPAAHFCLCQSCTKQDLRPAR
jgi:hypothetical protein